MVYTMMCSKDEPTYGLPFLAQVHITWFSVMKLHGLSIDQFIMCTCTNRSPFLNSKVNNVDGGKSNRFILLFAKAL